MAGSDLGREFGRSLVRRARPNPLVVLWRWRYEIGLSLVVAAAVTASSRALGWPWTVGSCVTLVSGLLGRPEVRRWSVVRAWCVITQHRVRVGCAHAWIHSRSGKLPAVLWTSPEDRGERVVLWCRAGTAAADLEAARHLLAAACWARDVEVTGDPEHAQIVVLHVVRRPVSRARRPRRPRGRPG
jgi:hypothetical protein